MPYARRLFRTVPTEAIKHRKEDDQQLIYDARTSPAVPNFYGVTFMEYASGYTPGNPGDIVKSDQVAEGSMVKSISYDIQMNMYQTNSNGNTGNPVGGSSLYVWPLSLSLEQAEILAEHAPTYFSLDANKNFSVTSKTEVDWDDLMAEFLKPEVTPILGKPIQFLPTTVSDAEKLKFIRLFKNRQIIREGDFYGWAVLWDGKARQDDVGTIPYDVCHLYWKILYNEFKGV